MAINRIFRTSAFKLTVLYLAVLSLLATFVIFYVASNTSDLLGTQLEAAIQAEVNGLSDAYRSGGIGRLARVVDQRSRRPGASLYLVTDFAGNPMVGNVRGIDASILASADGKPRPVRYRRIFRSGNEDPEDHSKTHAALVRIFVLPGGFRVLVGRDVSEREQFDTIIWSAFSIVVVAVILLGLLAWFFIGRGVLKRIESVSVTSRRIMAGDLSGRLQISGAGDEFDRLSENLNTMLERIEHLMTGLREVSDNIAHDLKTPLTRLRNRAEAALREKGDVAECRAALEDTIEASDQLIRTFDALLMIARVEAKSLESATGELDAVDIAAGMAELYEAVAEERGVGLSFTPKVDTAPFRGNRELIGQALANLLDNALKYGKASDGKGADGEGAEEGDDKPAVSIVVDGDDKEVRISVSDNGPGIAAADRQRVRERFVRLEKSRTLPGSGLGLSLVQAVASFHAGELRFEDAEPGLRAVLVLPAIGKNEGDAKK